MIELRIPKGKETLLDITSTLLENKLISSKGELRRLQAQGGISWNGEKVLTIDAKLPVCEVCMKIGKKLFVKLIPKN